MNPKVFVIGVGITKFVAPSKTADCEYMAREAVLKAMADANINYAHIKQACVGSVYGSSKFGQHALYTIGLTGLPIFNVSNGCSTGSSTLFLAKQLITNDAQIDCVLALGFDKMNKHLSNRMVFCQRTDQMYAAAGIEHMRKFGSNSGHLARIALKNHQHAVMNPYAQLQCARSLRDIYKSGEICDYLTRLQCCPASQGAAACILANERFVRQHRLEAQAVEIIGMEMTTDLQTTVQGFSMMNALGYDCTKKAADRLFSRAQLSADEVDVVELNDSYSINELMAYEALGLCSPGDAGKMVDSGDITYGGKYVINPSGGLLARGHSYGATGLAQCVELCWQLRGIADGRQVKNAKLALQHNGGLGDAVVVALYRLGFNNEKLAHVSKL